jgi:hypothetical protein
MRLRRVPVESEPFLLYPSSQPFLDGDARAIQERFRFRRDALDYLALVGVVAGGLLLIVTMLGYAGVVGSGDRASALSALGIAVVLMAAAGYFITSRHRWAAASERMVREGKVLAGTLIACSGRAETSAEASLGEVPSAFLVTVEYRFAAPMGDEITDQAECSRPELRRRELPEPGTAVRVLYLDDQTYALL